MAFARSGAGEMNHGAVTLHGIAETGPSCRTATVVHFFRTIAGRARDPDVCAGGDFVIAITTS